MSLQLSLIIGSILSFIFIFVMMIRFRMDVRYSVIWILWGLAILLIAFFPSLVDIISHIIGISVPTNTVFLIFIFLLYILSFYLFIRISVLNNEIKSLTYAISIVKKELDEKK